MSPYSIYTFLRQHFTGLPVEVIEAMRDERWQIVIDWLADCENGDISFACAQVMIEAHLGRNLRLLNCFERAAHFHSFSEETFLLLIRFFRLPAAEEDLFLVKASRLSLPASVQVLIAERRCVLVERMMGPEPYLLSCAKDLLTVDPSNRTGLSILRQRFRSNPSAYLSIWQLAHTESVGKRASLIAAELAGYYLYIEQDLVRAKSFLDLVVSGSIDTDSLRFDLAFGSESWGVCKKIIKGLRPTHPESLVLFRLGQICYRSGDQKQAGSLWKKAVDHGAAFPEIFLCLAEVSQELGDYEELLTWIDRLVAILPPSLGKSRLNTLRNKVEDGISRQRFGG